MAETLADLYAGVLSHVTVQAAHQYISKAKESTSGPRAPELQELAESFYAAARADTGMQQLAASYKVGRPYLTDEAALKMACRELLRVFGVNLEG